MSTPIDPQLAALRDQFATLVNSLKIPEASARAILDFQSKNVDAVAAAATMNRQAVEAASQRQREFLRQSLDDAIQQGRQTASTKTQQLTADQRQRFQQALEASIAATQTLAGMAETANRSAVALMQQRMNERIAAVASATPALPGATRT